MYQLRMYLCDKKILEDRATFSTLGEARAYRDAMRAEMAERTLTEFAFTRKVDT